MSINDLRTIRRALRVYLREPLPLEEHARTVELFRSLSRDIHLHEALYCVHSRPIDASHRASL